MRPRPAMRPHAGTAAFFDALQAAMPAGRDRTPAPTMFFARLSVDDVTDDLDATAAPPASAGTLNLGTGARRVGFSNALAAGASAMKVKRRIVFALAGLFARLLSDALRLFQVSAMRFGGGSACSGRLATRSCSKAVSDAPWECARGVFCNLNG